MKKLLLLNSKINIKNTNYIFIAGAIVILFSYVLFSGGMKYDGISDLLHMISGGGFHVLEYSRFFVHVLYKIPSYLFIKFPFFSFSTLTHIFSFGLIWIHIISILGCYLILPKHKKNLIFFPLFSFFIGPVVSLSVSISVSLSVCSYVWLTAFIIHYSNLSRKTQKLFFFITPLPLLLSHEFMSYMVWPLLFLCQHKNNTETNPFNRKLIQFIMCYFLLSSIVQLLMIFLHPYLTKSKALLHAFTQDIIPLKFLIAPQFNFTLILAVLTLILFFYIAYENQIKHKRKIKMCFYMIFLFILTASIFQTMKNFIPEYSVRFYPPIFILPWSLLAWWMYERKKINIEKAEFLLPCIFLCLNLVFFRVSSDYKFYKYQIQFSEYLKQCRGILNWEQISSQFKSINILNLEIFSESYIYPNSETVKSIIVPSLSLCIKDCGDELNCHKRCNRDLSKEVISSHLSKLNSTPFFNMSEILDSVSKEVSECE